ncbi:MAG: hypothetical protein RL204_439, partial [Bacteroidota bacterium]
YSNGNGFELKYSEEDEIRMGLWASDLSIYKNNRNVSIQLLTQNFLATLPNNYEPFSNSGRYCLIPTCPILDNPSLIIIDTENLAKVELNIKGALKNNQFAPKSETVLILGYTKVFLFDCSTNVSTEIEIPYNPDEIEHSYWFDSVTVRLFISSRTDRIQRILNYNTSTKEYETFEIISPGEVFGFEPLEEIVKSDSFCLFNAKGYSSATVGRLLNQWTFVNFDTELDLYKLRTNVPVSGIFYSDSWKMKGIKTIQQDVEFNFNVKGISGTENTTANIGYTAIIDELKEENSKVKSNIWSKLKRMWS